MLLVRCETREKSKASESPKPTADAAPATLSIGNRHELRHGKARFEERQLIIRLTDQPGPCGATLGAPWTAALSLEIPPGPGGRFFAGSPTGVRAFGVADDARIEIAPSDAIVTLEPFELTKGARVRGQLELPAGGGGFEAEVCAVESTVGALPTEAPNEPVAGILDGRPFRAKKALVYLAKDEPARLEHLRLSQDEQATCTDFRSSTQSPSLYFTQIGGSGARHPLLHTPQPAWVAAVHLPIERSYQVGRMPAWIRFDDLAFAPGARVTGVLVIEQVVEKEPPTRIAGRFEAEVCAH